MSQALLREPDEELEVAERPGEAFGRFYRRWQPRLVAYLRHHGWGRDVEEIAQETLARAYRRIDLARDDRATWSWLVTVARNAATDLHRQRRRCDVTADGDMVPLGGSTEADAVVEEVYGAQCLSQFVEALQDLPERHRNVWLMTVLGQLPPTEIARRLGCSVGAIDQLLHRTRPRLAVKLGGIRERVPALAPVFVLWRLVRFGRRHSGAAPGAGMVGVGLAAAAMGLSVLVQAPNAPTVHQVTLPQAGLVGHDFWRPPAGPAESRHFTMGVPAPAVAPRALVADPPAARSAVLESHSLFVAKHPLAPGEDVHVRVGVQTPVGNFVVDEGVARSVGSGLVCNRTNVVQCS